jgi:hypothetical protein
VLESREQPVTNMHGGERKALEEYPTPIERSSLRFLQICLVLFEWIFIGGGEPLKPLSNAS